MDRNNSNQMGPQLGSNSLLSGVSSQERQANVVNMQAFLTRTQASGAPGVPVHPKGPRLIGGKRYWLNPFNNGAHADATTECLVMAIPGDTATYTRKPVGWSRSLIPYPPIAALSEEESAEVNSHNNRAFAELGPAWKGESLEALDRMRNLKVERQYSDSDSSPD